jgi:SAM-dependent methyltransferase
MYDFGEDLAKFHSIALEAHARHTKAKNLYVALQTAVENSAHRRVAKLNSRRSRVLEIGVGGGEHLTFENAMREREMYVGIDIAFDFLTIAKSKFHIPAVVADAASLPFATGSFDSVVACSVLEHADRLVRVLTETDRVLAPGGIVLVVVPSNGGLTVSLFKLLVTYPFLLYRGIRRPDLVWNYLNVNCLKRVDALLRALFIVEKSVSVPWPFLPQTLSPMRLFVCSKRSGARSLS